ncbi:MAG: hypothetical protein GXC78_05690 [Chitinophagaceae bacterium]|nr:hypothetical protein [Chitinophagaceae bacterium]
MKEVFKNFLLVEMERQKNKLLLDHQRYTKLQVEQFDTLKLIFTNLIRTDRLVNETFVSLKDGTGLTKKDMERTFVPLVRIIFDTEDHFKQNSIFLPSETCEKIEKAIDALLFCLSRSTYAMLIRSESIIDTEGRLQGIQQVEIKNLSEMDKKDFHDTINKIAIVKNTELRLAISAVQTEFREIFGVK